MRMAASFAHLVQVEISGVQSYIFNGSRLREWCGHWMYQSSFAHIPLVELDVETVPR